MRTSSGPLGPRTVTAGLVALAGVSLAHLGGCSARDAGATGDRVARGQYLVQTMACNDCHTPWKLGANGPEPDRNLFLSGHPQHLAMEHPGVSPEWPSLISATNTAFAGPWGISYATNLTPDDTGLGVWTEDLFIQAMRNGKHMGGGRPILPPMPWSSYGQATDEDLRAVFAYLKSIRPIENAVPPPSPPPAS